MLLKEKIDVFLANHYDDKLSALVIGNASGEWKKTPNSFNSNVNLIVFGSKHSKTKTVYFNNLRFDVVYINKNRIGKEITRSLFGDNKFNQGLKNSYIYKDDLNLVHQTIDMSDRLFDIVSAYSYSTYKEISTYIYEIRNELNYLKTKDALLKYCSTLSAFNLLYDLVTKIKYPFENNTKYKEEILSSHQSAFSILLDVSQDQHPILDVSLLNGIFDKYGIQYYEENQHKTIGVVLDAEILKSLSCGVITDFYLGYDDLTKNNQIVYMNLDELYSLQQKVKKIDTVEYFNFTPGISTTLQFEFVEVLKQISKTTLTLPRDKRKVVLYKMFNYYSEKIGCKSFERAICKIVLQKVLEPKMLDNQNISIAELETIMMRLHLKVNVNKFHVTDKEMDQFFCSVEKKLIDLDKKIVETTIKAERIDVYINQFFRILKSLRLEITDIVKNKF